MTIEFIDNTNKFLDDVKALGRKNSTTLGFMPEGGFEDHARNKCIIIARQEDELLGYLMYRVVSVDVYGIVAADELMDSVAMGCYLIDSVGGGEYGVKRIHCISLAGYLIDSIRGRKDCVEDI